MPPSEINTAHHQSAAFLLCACWNCSISVYIKLQLIMNVRNGYKENTFSRLEIDTISSIPHSRERIQALYYVAKAAKGCITCRQPQMAVRSNKSPYTLCNMITENCNFPVFCISCNPLGLWRRSWGMRFSHY